jgi:hypothetical protein
MPTLISELSPLQQTWLYDNQLTRGDSYEEKWHRFDSAFDTTIFRSKSQKRKLPFAEYPIKSRRTNSSTERSMVIVTNGPRYPHTDDKLTWMQSFENLRVYCNHYGVRAVHSIFVDICVLPWWKTMVPPILHRFCSIVSASVSLV